MDCPRFGRTTRSDQGGPKPELGDVLVSDDGPRRVEGIVGLAEWRCWAAYAKPRVVRGSLMLGAPASAAARRNGVAPNPLFHGRRLLAEGRARAVGSNEPVVSASEARCLEERAREFERPPGRKTMEAESLEEVLVKAGAR